MQKVPTSAESCQGARFVEFIICCVVRVSVVHELACSGHAQLTEQDVKFPGLVEDFVRADDGTRLATHKVGSGLPVLLCNGLGGSWMAWHYQLEFFADRYRFLSWDYRGLYGSEPPANPNALRVQEHAADALRVMEAHGLKRVAVFGWSMGVQVALELFRAAPERVAALVLVNGVPGRPWEAIRGVPFARSLVPPMIRGARALPWIAETMTRRVLTMPEAVHWVKRLGLASRTLDDDVFATLVQSFENLDMRTYMTLLGLLGEHDASDMLSDVDIPALVIAGARDRFTPRRAAEHMVQRIPGAEFLVVPGGTHYVAVEYPELVNLRIQKFFRERGYAS